MQRRQAMDATKSKPDASMAAAIEHAASGMMQSTWKFFLPDSDKPPPPKPVGDDERIIDIIGEQIEFLHRSYEGRCWYWEVLETIRRLLLTAVVSIVDAGSNDQVIFSIVIAVAYMKLYAYFQPFADKKDDMLQEIAQYQIFFTLFIALILRGQLLIGDVWITGMDAVLIVLNSVTPIVALSFIIELNRAIFGEKKKRSDGLRAQLNARMARGRAAVSDAVTVVQSTKTYAAVEHRLYRWGILKLDPSILDKYKYEGPELPPGYGERRDLADDLGLRQVSHYYRRLWWPFLQVFSHTHLLS